MPTFSLTLTGISPKIMRLLKQSAKVRRTSINALILQMIEQELGLNHKRRTYYDLDYLAGTWSAEEAREFKENIRCFGQIETN